MKKDWQTHWDKIMQEAGYQADIVYDGRDGLAYASSGDYDVIVLDVMLPGMNGFEVGYRLESEETSWSKNCGANLCSSTCHWLP